MLKVLREVMPYENFIYYGDSANAPYGEKSTDEVTSAAENVVKKLLAHGVKAIVIACNTATSAAAKYLREKYDGISIIGMEPAVKPAALSGEHPTVLVMATPLTLREEKFRRLIEKYRDTADFIEVACHGLVELVESGITDGDVMDSYLEELFAVPLKDKKIDAAVLGCTHYIHARRAIQRALGEDVTLHDGALGTAREVMNRLLAAELLNDSGIPGVTTILNSAQNEELLALSRELFER